MALYTLKSRDEALLPLANYNGDNTWIRNQMTSLGYAPTPAQTQVYSALGRTTGAEGNGGSNFFERRGRSIENAFGTTGSSIVSAVNDRIENDKTAQMLKDNKTRMNDIAKKYGFNSWSDWQDANAAARESGDTEAIKRFDTQLKEFQAQANANAAKANEKAANYEDYRKNDYISNKINQDRGKFAGSAINTLSTAVDVTGLGATPVSNAIQGGIEGVADELEQNGLENFDWGRAGQNAAIGATTGAVTGALNAGISNSLAKRAAAKGLTNTAAKAGIGNALKSGAKTIATGAARGALSGAVGGATGAGLQSALNGVEFGQGVQNALQGAVQGAQQGAVTGGIMAGANAAFGKTNFGKQLQNAKTNWDQSGSNFDERLTNTLTSGDSAVGDWLMNKRQSNVLGAAGNLGNRISPVGSPKYNKAMDLAKRALNEFEQADPYEYEESMTNMAEAEGLDWNTAKGKKAFTEKWLKDTTRDILTGGDNREMWAGSLEDYVDAPSLDNGVNPINGGTVRNAELQQLISDIRSFDQAQTPTTAKGWAKKAGQRIVEDINNSNLGNRVKDVSSDMPEDIRNMQIRDYNADADGELTPSRFSRDAFEAGDDSRNELIKAINRYNSNTPEEADRIMNLSNDGSTITMVGNKKKVPVEQMLGVLGMDNGDYNNGTITVEEALARAGINPSDTTRPQTTAPVELDPWDRVAQEAGYSNYDEVLQRYAEANPNAKINPRGMAGQVLTWMDQNPNTPTTASGWAKRAGQRAVEDINNSNLGLKVQDVSQDDPSKRLYNALAGNRQPVAETEVETETDMGVVPSRTSKESKMRYAQGKELLAQYGTVDQPMARASRAVESVQEIANAGFTKPEDVEKMANVVTGSNGEVSKLTRNLIKNAAPVDTFTGDNGQTIEDFIDNSIELNSLYGTSAGAAAKRTIEANMRSLPSRAAGSVSYTDNPEDVFKVVQNLEASAAELEGRGGSTYHRPTIENIHQAKVLKDTASMLKDRLYDGVDVKQALTPEVADNLKSYDPKNKAWADYVDNKIMGAKSIGDLRSAQAPWVRMSKYIDNAYTQAATVGGRMASNASDLSRILTTRNGLLKAGIDTVWNSNAARRGRAAVYDKLADRAADKAANTPDTAAGWAKQAGKRAAEDLGKTNLGNRIQDVSDQPVNPQVATPAELANTVADYNPSTQLYNAIGRTEGVLAQETPAQYLANAAQEAEIVSPMEAPTAPTNDIATSMSNTSTATYNALTGTPTTTQQATTGSINTGYYQPTGDYWTDIIASAMSAAIDANDVDAFATLFGMYQDQMANLQKQTSSEKDYSDPTNWSSADRTKLLSAQNAMGQIDQLEEAYNQATGGEGSNAIQGWLRSRASDISGGNWDPSASNYNSLSESVGMGIVKNLINLGVTEADAQRYLKYLPALTDTKEQAAQKLDTLRGIYQNQINNLYGAYGL